MQLNTMVDLIGQSHMSLFQRHPVNSSNDPRSQVICKPSSARRTHYSSAMSMAPYIETSGPDNVQTNPRTRARRTMGVADIAASCTHQPPIPTTIPSPDYHGDINAEPLHELTHVVLGNHVMRPVYPHSYPRRPIGNATIAGYQFVCQYCFKYTVDMEHAAGHSRLCDMKKSEALGSVVFRSNKYTIHELDGEEHLVFCQNLSLFAKMFLETKSVCYGVDSFLFYTLVRNDPTDGAPCVVGFFSKEKMSWHNYNLACILVFPPYQRLGLGKLLIGFSYELSRRHGSIGSPETPLSDLGLKGYCAYWTYAISRVLLYIDQPTITINQLSQLTYIHHDDILYALKTVGWLVYGAEQAMYIKVVPRTLKSCATRLQENQIPVELLGELPLRSATDVED